MEALVCRRVRLTIRTTQFELGGASLFDRVMMERLKAEIDRLSDEDAEMAEDEDEIWDEEFEDESDEDDKLEDGRIFADFDSEQKLELVTEAELTDDGKRVEIRYEETELTGMEGAVTCISYDREAPGIVSMLRGGSVYTVLIFEAGKRHICAYETPVMPFELCIFTRTVCNTIDVRTGGSLDLDYLIEMRGAGTEHTLFHMDVALLEPDRGIGGERAISYDTDERNAEQ